MGNRMPSAKVEPDFAALDHITEGSNKFVINLYQELSKKSGNMVVSPVSVQMVLALAHQGAKGATADEIASALGLPQDKDILLRAHQSLIHLLQLPVLKLANGIFVDEGFKVNTKFQEVATKYFMSSGERVKFSSQPEEARQTINSWVEDKTENRIKELLAQGVVDSMTRLVLVNAIHFKANWEHRFDEMMTDDQPFYSTPDEPVTVKMMHLNKKLRYSRHEQLSSHLLELPYEGGDMRMIIILPIERNGLAEVERKLATVNLSEELSKLSLVTVHLSLPRFKLEQTIDLNDLLQEMGMKSMFGDGADLSGMTEDGDVPLRVSKVIQKAFIEVNEKGTEAAAATDAAIMMRCLIMAEEVVADHPFIYVLRHHKTNTTLMMGSVNSF